KATPAESPKGNPSESSKGNAPESCKEKPAPEGQKPSTAESVKITPVISSEWPAPASVPPNGSGESINQTAERKIGAGNPLAKTLAEMLKVSAEGRDVPKGLNDILDRAEAAQPGSRNVLAKSYGEVVGGGVTNDIRNNDRVTGGPVSWDGTGTKYDI